MLVNKPSRYAALELQLGYAFQKETLCECALTHKSWLNERADSGRSDNERLEFLGDAVISVVVSDLLMRRFPDHPEGELSKKRAALVNEGGLAAVAEALALGQWIFLGRGEEQAGGRQKRSILADAFEAIVGAVYQDGGFDAAFGVVEKLFESALHNAGRAANRDYKSRLQEISQARLHVAPTYTIIGQHGPDHDKTFEVAISLDGVEYGRARGKSKKEAQQNAAARALEALSEEKQSPRANRDGPDRQNTDS